MSNPISKTADGIVGLVRYGYHRRAWLSALGVAQYGVKSEDIAGQLFNHVGRHVEALAHIGNFRVGQAAPLLYGMVGHSAGKRRQ